MNENFSSGSKTQFKKKNCIEWKVPRHTSHLQPNSYAFKRGLLLQELQELPPPPPEYFVV
ncbi:MAG: hypothetical protein V7K50_20700 [Nostoc sp.]|uniref:hypothetical protein n=1 Tax=Nostoc sp. TaxID=1180 RepID=UPI002FF6CB1F